VRFCWNSRNPNRTIFKMLLIYRENWREFIVVLNALQFVTWFMLTDFDFLIWFPLLWLQNEIFNIKNY
jgi:hypothetical protein